MEILKRTHKRHQDHVLWVWLEIFSPSRGTISKTTHNFFSVQYFKSTAKASAVDFLRLNTLRGSKTAFVTPSKYGEPPFNMGVPTGHSPAKYTVRV